MVLISWQHSSLGACTGILGNLPAKVLCDPRSSFWVLQSMRAIWCWKPALEQELGWSVLTLLHSSLRKDFGVHNSVGGVDCHCVLDLIF